MAIWVSMREAWGSWHVNSRSGTRERGVLVFTHNFRDFFVLGV